MDGSIGAGGRAPAVIVSRAGSNRELPHVRSGSDRPLDDGVDRAAERGEKANIAVIVLPTMRFIAEGPVKHLVPLRLPSDVYDIYVGYGWLFGFISSGFADCNLMGLTFFTDKHSMVRDSGGLGAGDRGSTRIESGRDTCRANRLTRMRLDAHLEGNKSDASPT